MCQLDRLRQLAQREKLLNQMDEIRRLTRIVDGLTLLTKADAEEMDAEELSSLFKAVMDARNEHNQEAAAKN